MSSFKDRLKNLLGVNKEKDKIEAAKDVLKIARSGEYRKGTLSLADALKALFSGGLTKDDVKDMMVYWGYPRNKIDNIFSVVKEAKQTDEPDIDDDEKGLDFTDDFDDEDEEEEFSPEIKKQFEPPSAKEVEVSDELFNKLRSKNPSDRREAAREIGKKYSKRSEGELLNALGKLAAQQNVEKVLTVRKTIAKAIQELFGDEMLSKIERMIGRPVFHEAEEEETNDEEEDDIDFDDEENIPETDIDIPTGIECFNCHMVMKPGDKMIATAEGVFCSPTCAEEYASKIGYTETEHIKYNIKKYILNESPNDVVDNAKTAKVVEPAKDTTLDDVIVLDDGGKSKARYTVVIKDRLFTMDENPLTSKGLNRYLGQIIGTSSLVSDESSEWGKRITIPPALITAVKQRLAQIKSGEIKEGMDSEEEMTEDDKPLKVLAKGIMDKATADKMAVDKKGSVGTDPDDKNKFIVFVKETIKKIGGKYQVQSHKGKNLGTYSSKPDAEKRLQQIEFFKHRNMNENTEEITPKELWDWALKTENGNKREAALLYLDTMSGGASAAIEGDATERIINKIIKKYEGNELEEKHKDVSIIHKLDKPIIFTKDELDLKWSKGKPVIIQDMEYRVVKLSTGEYFLEPGKEHGETEEFNIGTLYPEKDIIKNQYGKPNIIYTVSPIEYEMSFKENEMNEDDTDTIIQKKYGKLLGKLKNETIEVGTYTSANQPNTPRDYPGYVEEDAMTFKYPAALYALARKAGKSKSDAERYWRETEKSMKSRGINKKDFNYKQIMGVVKKRLGLPVKPVKEDVFDSVAKYHQKQIAKKTLRLSDVGASIMGGMTKEEARKFLKSVGWNDQKIRDYENAEYVKETTEDNDDVENTHECPECGGEMNSLGKLGKREHFRCKNYGIQTSRNIMKEDDDLSLDAQTNLIDSGETMDVYEVERNGEKIGKVEQYKNGICNAIDISGEYIRDKNGNTMKYAGEDAFSSAVEDIIKKSETKNEAIASSDIASVPMRLGIGSTTNNPNKKYRNMIKRRLNNESL